MFKICQGTCFCAANSDSNIRDARETVLYCFGEVDIDMILKKSYFKLSGCSQERQSSRRRSLSQNIFTTNSRWISSSARSACHHLPPHLPRLDCLAVDQVQWIYKKMILIIYVTMFRKGLLRIIIQMRRIVRVLEYQGQSDTLKRDKEYLR